MHIANTLWTRYSSLLFASIHDAAVRLHNARNYHDL